MEKEAYASAIIEIIRFGCKDVITESNQSGGSPIEFPDLP